MTNQLEAQLEYPFGDELPCLGTTLQVSQGINWLRMPLPFALNHINLWLLADKKTTEPDFDCAKTTQVTKKNGWSIVDCGIANDETRNAWQQIFTKHCQKDPVFRIIATHCHPDHIGSADWLCSHWQVPLWTSCGEYSFARMLSAGLPGVDGVAALPHFERHGLVDPVLLDAMRSRNNYYPSLVPSVPHSYIRLQDKQQILIGDHQWQIITGFGHSPEHASLYCKDLGVLISGDMVLPRISTNISVFAVEPEANPLQLYLDSLEKFADLPADTLVLPSHGKPFRGLLTRIAQLRAHHEARLNEVLHMCVTPQSAADIIPIMFQRPLDAHQRSFAMGESLAHLNFLWQNGQLCRKLCKDSVIRYQRTVTSDMFYHCP
jgi:glyoxylase-like metal-dependent hydrolase (beta-lactamase superfamily II)